tara:strand:+ start:43284 stop:46760 length:3477 start_codon:yes stop_codon:yes gene_type:complete
MSCRLVLFLIAILSFSAFAETTIKIPLMQDPILKITSTDESVTYIDEAIDMPWRSQEHLSYLGVPHDQDYSLTVYDNSGKMSVWRIDAEQDIVLEFAPGESPKHFTYLPILMGGTVNVIDVETDEVIYTTKTKNDGSWQFEYTGNIADLPEYVLIDMVGGLAMGKPRDPSNKMMAYVQSIDLYAGSITTSIFTTAAYMSISEDKHHLIHEEFIDYYHLNNSKLISFGFETNIPHEKAIYFRQAGVAVGNDYINSASEFIAPSFNEFNESMWDAMSNMSNKEQRDAFSGYFSTLNGWGRAEEKRTFRTTFTTIGEGSIKIDGNDVDLIDVSNGQGLYRSKEYVFDKENPPIINYEDNSYSSFQHWNGCMETHNKSCTPINDSGGNITAVFSKKSKSVNSTLIRKEYLEDFLSITNERLSFAGNTEITTANAYLKQLSVATDLSTTYYTFDNEKWFSVTSKNIPTEETEKSDISYYYADIVWTYENPKGQHYDEHTENKTNLDLWIQLMGEDEPYQGGYVIDIGELQPNDDGYIARGFVTNERSESTDLEFVKIKSIYPSETLSNLRLATPSLCADKRYTKTKASGKSSLDGSVSARVCDPILTHEEVKNVQYGVVSYKIHKLDVGGKLILNGTGGGEIVIPKKLVDASPFVRAEMSLDNFTLDSDFTIFIETFTIGPINITPPIFSSRKNKFITDVASVSGTGYLSLGLTAGVGVDPVAYLSARIGLSATGKIKQMNIKDLDSWRACGQYDDIVIEFGGELFAEGALVLGGDNHNIKLTAPSPYTKVTQITASENQEMSASECLNPSLNVTELQNSISYVKGSTELPTSAQLTIKNDSKFKAKVSLRFADKLRTSKLIHISDSTLDLGPGESRVIVVTGKPEMMETAKVGSHSTTIDIYSSFGKGFGPHAERYISSVSVGIQIQPVGSKNYQVVKLGYRPYVTYEKRGVFYFRGVNAGKGYPITSSEIKRSSAKVFSDRIGRVVNPDEIELSLLDHHGNVLLTEAGRKFKVTGRHENRRFYLYAHMPEDGPLSDASLGISSPAGSAGGSKGHVSYIGDCSCTDAETGERIFNSVNGTLKWSHYNTVRYDSKIGKCYLPDVAASNLNYDGSFTTYVSSDISSDWFDIDGRTVRFHRTRSTANVVIGSCTGNFTFSRAFGY